MNISLVKHTFSRIATMGGRTGIQMDIKRLIKNEYGQVICDTRKRLPSGQSLGSILGKLVEQGISLSGCDFSGMNLEGADLIGADLAGANLSGADLSDAMLSSAVLDHANLTGAILINTQCSYASMEGTDLTNAYMIDADFSYADMTDAEIDTNHTNPNILGVDFHGAIWDRWDPRELTPGIVLAS